MKWSCLIYDLLIILMIYIMIVSGIKMVTLIKLLMSLNNLTLN
jgi:hypothetical protein